MYESLIFVADTLNTLNRWPDESHVGHSGSLAGRTPDSPFGLRVLTSEMYDPRKERKKDGESVEPYFL